MGNKITQMSPTRGFAVELGAAVTVLLASRLGLPVSTTQCLTGAALGVALMNYDLGAVNWRQLAFIFMGWVRFCSTITLNGLSMLTFAGYYTAYRWSYLWCALRHGAERTVIVDAQFRLMLVIAVFCTMVVGHRPLCDFKMNHQRFLGVL